MEKLSTANIYGVGSRTNEREKLNANYSLSPLDFYRHELPNAPCLAVGDHDEWLSDYDRAGETKNKHEPQAVRGNDAGLRCECIDVRKAEINTQGGKQHTFVLELYAEEINKILVKFFNCESTTKGFYKVRRDSDFAKLYRLTKGGIDVKRFSKAHQLLGHFLGCRFIVEQYESANLKSGEPYLKVLRIKPETPLQGDWTACGTLKKRPKIAQTRRKTGDRMAKNGRKTGGKLETVNRYR